MTTAVERTIPARDIPRGQSPMELLTPRELNQTTEVRIPTAAGRETTPVASDTLGDLVVEQTAQKLMETAGRLVSNRRVPGSGVTAPYGTIDDTGKVELSQEAMRRTGADTTTRPMKTSTVPHRKIREVPMRKVSHVFDIQKNNQAKNHFTGVPEADMRACFNRSTWGPAVNKQQSRLGASSLILGDSLVRVLQNLRNSWITTVMSFGGATIAQLY